jgi:hypothetical protein
LGDLTFNDLLGNAVTSLPKSKASDARVPSAKHPNAVCCCDCVFYFLLCWGFF